MVIEKLGRYVIVEEIGQGAMGVVYKAVDPLIDRTVAIKTINLDLSKEELANFEKRFQREVQSAGKLNHPNIVTVYDVGRTEGVAYMAMEFLEGKELREILDSGVVLPIEKVVHIATQVAEGLGFAHEHGIVHRDVKPSNVMVLKNGLVKITDFGIAQMSSATRTISGMVMGSPKYMSPEQVVGQAVDGRSDIFSLGVMLYEMLTGKTPFAGDNISAIMYQILNDEPIPPKTFNQGIPEAVNFIVLKALAKHPDKRYQNAKEMARDLKRYKSLELPVPGEEPKQPEPMERRRLARENLGDATQIIPSLVLTEQSTLPANGAASQASWWAGMTFHRFLLYAAIPAMIITFAVVVSLSKIRQAKSVPDPIVSTVASPPATPDAATQAQHAQPNPPQAPQAQLAPPKVVENPIPDKATDKIKVISEKIKSASADSAKKGDELKPAATGESHVTFAVSPWGEVFVDGKRQGVSPPLRDLKLSAGKHTILIVNETFKPYSQTIELAPNSTHKIKYKFQN
ncbi:MAG: protein kinase [Burkholderiales bacterium]|nr:protein kinase [Burkholderiales bacterium]